MYSQFKDMKTNMIPMIVKGSI